MHRVDLNSPFRVTLCDGYDLVTKKFKEDNYLLSLSQKFTLSDIGGMSKGDCPEAAWMKCLPRTASEVGELAATILYPWV